MAVDTPAKIAILGAGPIGLEAALYARFLGYEVEVFDRGEVAEHVRRWGHVRMFSPFAHNVSTLGLAALEAQDEQFRPPEMDALLTGQEWRERYLLPLSHTDLLEDHLRLRTNVVSVSRRDFLKTERIEDEQRAESPFRILARERDGREWESLADIVIDATGVLGNANWLGSGGAAAIGERDLRDRIDYTIPDAAGADRSRFENQHVLLIGSGHSAATTVVALRVLAETAPATRVSWLVRESSRDDGSGPVASVPNDGLPERARLVAAANRAAQELPGIVEYRPGTVVHSVAWDDSRGLFDVVFRGEHSGRDAFDRVVANVGYRPDARIFEELQVDLCCATGGPMKLAASLLAVSELDGLPQVAAGPAALLTSEPNFYILGAKSFGRNPNFLVALGLRQIRDLFTIIGDRDNLDLYQGSKRLPK